MCSLDSAAHGVDNELHAVADAEHGELVMLAVFEKAVGHTGGTLDMDAVGATREDNGAGVGTGDALLRPWLVEALTRQRACGAPWRRRRA